MSRLPLVSVVIPAYNSARTLDEAVESVLAQSVDELEVLIVDDGSTDQTAAYLHSIPDKRLTILQPGRGGRAAALNLAVGAANAPFLANLDADDLMLPGRLARQAHFLEQNPDIGLVGSSVIWQNKEGQRETRHFPSKDAALRQRLFTGYPFAHSSVMYRRRDIQKACVFDPTLACALDYDLFCRLAATEQLANLAEPLTVRRVHDSNFFIHHITPKQYWHALWQIKWRYWVAAGRPYEQLPRLLATTILSGVGKWWRS